MIRRPDHVVGRWVLLVGLGHATSVLAVATASSALALGAAGADAARWFGWLAGLATLLGSGVFYLALIFPTGRGHTRRGTASPDRRWRCIVAHRSCAIVAPAGPLHLFPALTNPLGIGPSLALLLGERCRLRPLVVIGVVAFGPLVVASMVTRYRRRRAGRTGTARWFVSAVALTLASLAIVGIASRSRIGLGQAPLVAFGLAGSTVPIAIGIAILRYRLYEIDRIVSRTIGWLAVTTIVGSVFVVAVVGPPGRSSAGSRRATRSRSPAPRSSRPRCSSRSASASSGRSTGASTGRATTASARSRRSGAPPRRGGPRRRIARSRRRHRGRGGPAAAAACGCEERRMTRVAARPSRSAARLVWVIAALGIASSALLVASYARPTADATPPRRSRPCPWSGACSPSSCAAR